MKLSMMAGLFALALTPGAALAADDACTDEMLTKKQEALGAYLQANPEKAAKMHQAVAPVEAKYGGAPPREKQCMAMDDLRAELEKL